MNKSTLALALSLGVSCLANATTPEIVDNSLTIVSATDWGGSHAKYPASNVIDDNYDWSSRWAASGSPVNLVLNLDSVQKVDSIGISWGRGDERTHTFEVWARAELSGTWTKVFDGISSGTSDGLQIYDLGGIEAQQVRVKTFENSAGTTWTNIKEVEVFGNGEAIASASSDDGNVAANAVDGDIATRWSAKGDGQWLMLDHGYAQYIDTANIAFFKGDQRSAYFDIETSIDGETWSPVLTNATSAGNSIASQTFALTGSQARFVRYVGFGNSANSWNSVTEFSASAQAIGLLPEYPADLMENYKQWKITYLTGEEVKNLAQETNEYFYLNDSKTGIVFNTPINQTNATTIPVDAKTELRERVADGSMNIYWQTSGKHALYAKQAITHLPMVKQHLVTTQVHGNKDEGIDDAMVLRLEDQHLFLSFNGGVLRDDLTVTTNYQLGTVHEVLFEIIDGKHYAYYSEDGNLANAYASGNAAQYLIKDGNNDYLLDVNYTEGYFKLGSDPITDEYKEGDLAGHPDNYGEVVVYDFSVSHQ